MTDEKSPDNEMDSAEEPEEQPEEVSPEAEADPETELSDILKKLEEAESRAEAMHGRSLRALAELDNYRKRMARDRQDIRRSAAAEVIESLLPALDNLKLGLQSATNPDSLQDVVKGFEMIGNQILGALNEQGLQELNPEGEDFDPHFHDSVSTEAHAEMEEGKVLRTLKVGYLLNDKLLRPATVVVSSGPEAAAAEADSEESAEETEENS